MNQIDRLIRQRDRQINYQIDRQINYQKDRQIDRWIGQKDRQIDRLDQIRLDQIRLYRLDQIRLIDRQIDRDARCVYYIYIRMYIYIYMLYAYILQKRGRLLLWKFRPNFVLKIEASMRRGTPWSRCTWRERPPTSELLRLLWGTSGHWCR